MTVWVVVVVSVVVTDWVVVLVAVTVVDDEVPSDITETVFEN